VKPGPPKLRRDKNERKEYRIQRRNDLLVEAGWQLPANPTAGTTPDANAEGDAAAGAEGPTGEEAAGTGAEDPNSRRARLKRKTADKLAAELERNGKPTATGKAAAIARKFQHVPSIVTDGTGRHQRTVFVGNIPPELSKPGIVRALFTDCGVLLEVRPIRRDGRDFTGPKMCYCEFDSVASAQKATEKNGMTLGRNPLRINMAHDKNERLKAVQKKCHLKPQDAEKVNCRLLYASQRRLRLDAIEAGKSGRMKDILKELQPSNPPPPLVHPSRRPDAPVDPAVLRQYGVTHVLSLGERPDLQDVPVKALHVDVEDTERSTLAPHLPLCFAFIDEARSAGGVVMVHCLAGVSRTGAVVIAYLMHHFGAPLRDAFLLAWRKRPILQPNDAFLEELVHFEEQMFPTPSLPIAAVKDFELSHRMCFRWGV
jgi:hypothetical protein